MKINEISLREDNEERSSRSGQKFDALKPADFDIISAIGSAADAGYDRNKRILDLDKRDGSFDQKAASEFISDYIEAQRLNKTNKFFTINNIKDALLRSQRTKKIKIGDKDKFIKYLPFDTEKGDTTKPTGSNIHQTVNPNTGLGSYLGKLIDYFTGKPGQVNYPLLLIRDLTTFKKDTGLATPSSVAGDFTEILAPVALLTDNLRGNGGALTKKLFGVKAFDKAVQQAATINFHPSTNFPLIDSVIEYNGKTVQLSSKNNGGAGASAAGLAVAIDEIQRNPEAIRLFNAEIANDKDYQKAYEFIKILTSNDENYQKLFAALELYFGKNLENDVIAFEAVYLKPNGKKFSDPILNTELKPEVYEKFTPELQRLYANFRNFKAQSTDSGVKNPIIPSPDLLMKALVWNVTMRVNSTPFFSEVATWILNHAAVIQVDSTANVGQNDDKSNNLVLTNFTATWPSQCVETVELVQDDKTSFNYRLHVNGFQTQFSSENNQRVNPDFYTTPEFQDYIKAFEKLKGQGLDQNQIKAKLEKQGISRPNATVIGYDYFTPDSGAGLANRTYDIDKDSDSKLRARPKDEVNFKTKEYYQDPSVPQDKRKFTTAATVDGGDNVDLGTADATLYQWAPYTDEQMKQEGLPDTVIDAVRNTRNKIINIINNKDKSPAGEKTYDNWKNPIDKVSGTYIKPHYKYAHDKEELKKSALEQIENNRKENPNYYGVPETKQKTTRAAVTKTRSGQRGRSVKPELQDYRNQVDQIFNWYNTINQQFGLASTIGRKPSGIKSAIKLANRIYTQPMTPTLDRELRQVFKQVKALVATGPEYLKKILNKISQTQELSEEIKLTRSDVQLEDLATIIYILYYAILARYSKDNAGQKPTHDTAIQYLERIATAAGTKFRLGGNIRTGIDQAIVNKDSRSTTVATANDPMAAKWTDIINQAKNSNGKIWQAWRQVDAQDIADVVEEILTHLRGGGEPLKILDIIKNYI